jgi:hypothetical protein
MNKAERNLFIMVKAAKELFRIGSIAILIFMWLVQGRIGEALAWFLCWIILDEFDRRWRKGSRYCTYDASHEWSGRK